MSAGWRGWRIWLVSEEAKRRRELEKRLSREQLEHYDRVSARNDWIRTRGAEGRPVAIYFTR